jgi:CHAT domain-containing protein
VPDDSTAALMSEFYTQLQQQPDWAQALRQAMLKTMTEYPDPIDWAAFTLIGEAEIEIQNIGNYCQLPMST